MKKQIWKLAGVVLIAGANWSGAVPPSPDYRLLYTDEFDGNALNEKDWICREGLREGLHFHDSLNRKENVSVSGGVLHIAARQEPVNGKMYNTGGGVISKHQFGYGYYETLSTPFMTGHGVHSAFWQCGGARGEGNTIFEIDGYEIDSTDPMACHNLYVRPSPKGYNEVPWVHRANVPFKINADGSYLCGCEYTPQGVVYYSQGKVVAKADWPELTAAQVVLLTALNGVGKVDGQPGETTFQYFRYYAKDYPGVNLLPNGSFEYNQDKCDPAHPVCWEQTVKGGKVAMVMEGDAARDRYRLRHGSAAKPFEAATWQTLEYILNGDYELAAKVRRSPGTETALIRVSNYGGPDIVVDVPAGTAWTPVTIPRVPVSNQGVMIRLESKGTAGQWVEFDDVRFQKPALPGQKPTEPPFQLIRDPIWSLAEKDPIRFTGDGKFYFFDRNVGLGEAMTVSFVMNPACRANTCPIVRMPKTGTSGWAVQLTEQGQVIFRIGSSTSNQAVVAEAQYATNAETRVTCAFDRGVARIYVNGGLKQTESGIPFNTQDTTAAGRLGSVNAAYEAVGVVIAHNGKAGDGVVGTIPRHRNYVGILRNVRVYNRALADAEVARLAEQQGVVAEETVGAGCDFKAMLQPAPVTAKFSDPDYYVWCGSMVKGDDGKYHLFYSRWPREYGFEAWVTRSEIAHAVGDTPLGPFHHKDVALPERGKEFWDGLCTHNPTVLRFGGKFYLYYMGNVGDRKQTRGLNWVHRNNQRIGVAVADSPDGPWRRLDKPLIDVSKDEAAPDALMVSNPSVCERPDGGYLMVYKGVGKKDQLPFGGPVVHLTATADSPTGPFVKQLRPIFTAPGVNFSAEDPFIWFEKSSNRYQAIVKDQDGYFTKMKGRSLALWESRDGFDWKVGSHPLVTRTEIQWDDGRTEKLVYLERPQLYFEDGIPSVLLCAASRNPGKGSFNVRIPLRIPRAGATQERQ